MLDPQNVVAVRQTKRRCQDLVLAFTISQLLMSVNEQKPNSKHLTKRTFSLASLSPNMEDAYSIFGVR